MEQLRIYSQYHFGHLLHECKSQHPAHTKTQGNDTMSSQTEIALLMSNLARSEKG